MGSLFRTIPTKKRLKELDNVICLCANCHRELHHGENYKALTIEYCNQYKGE